MVRTWPTLPVCRPLLSREGWAWGGGGMHFKDRIRIENPNTRDGGAIFQERVKTRRGKSAY